MSWRNIKTGYVTGDSGRMGASGIVTKPPPPPNKTRPQPQPPVGPPINRGGGYYGPPPQSDFGRRIGLGDDNQLPSPPPPPDKVRPAPSPIAPPDTGSGGYYGPPPESDFGRRIGLGDSRFGSGARNPVGMFGANEPHPYERQDPFEQLRRVLMMWRGR